MLVAVQAQHADGQAPQLVLRDDPAVLDLARQIVCRRLSLSDHGNPARP